MARSDFGTDAFDTSLNTGFEFYENPLWVGSLVGKYGPDLTDDAVTILLLDFHGQSLLEFVSCWKVSGHVVKSWS